MFDFFYVLFCFFNLCAIYLVPPISYILINDYTSLFILSFNNYWLSTYVRHYSKHKGYISEKIKILPT